MRAFKVSKFSISFLKLIFSCNLVVLDSDIIESLRLHECANQ